MTAHGPMYKVGMNGTGSGAQTMEELTKNRTEKYEWPHVLHWETAVKSAPYPQGFALSTIFIDKYQARNDTT